MSAVRQQTMSVEEYLAFERSNEARHEYRDGEIVAMPSATSNHGIITIATLASLHVQLRNRPASVLPCLMRIKVEKTGLYTYSDICVVFDPLQLEDDGYDDTLLNPTLIVEVLSPSTESYDRGRKFQHYRALESLQEYVLIAQDSPHIERYLRQPSGEWLLADATGLDARIELSSIGCTLALADVYEKVSFEDSPA
ncbi:MAG: Uma2 family endonuclease [Anaerolineae bacterium]|nr:Uma2 family endonuclease [Anaerolineae bacterium]